MPITYEKKVAPFQAGCCFLPYSSNSGPTTITSPKIFKRVNFEENILVSESQKQIKEKKQGIQSMKKSISTINLKRKYSEGFPTNRVSLNQSQFMQKPTRRFITNSMDTEVLKDYIPHYQSTQDLNLRGTIDQPYEQKNFQYFLHGHQTLDSLAQRFKKSRDVKIQQFVQKTKKHKVDFYPVQASLQTHNLQKTSAKQCYQKSNLTQQFNQKFFNYPIKYRQEDILPQIEQDIIRNPQEMSRAEPIQQNQQNRNQSSEQIKFQMNQVDSMIIEINQPKSPSIMIEKKAFLKKAPYNLGVNKQITESKHFGGSQITKTKKKSITGQRQLANCDTMTVNSDYEEDIHEKTQKIEESAIIMNFFNPPSFIKDKLSLSGTRHG